MLFDSSLDDLRDVFESGSVLFHHVVAQCYTVTGVSIVACHLQYSVEMATSLIVTLLLRREMKTCTVHKSQLKVQDVT